MHSVELYIVEMKMRVKRDETVEFVCRQHDVFIDLH